MYQLDAIQLSKNVRERLTEFVTDDSFVRDRQLSQICRRIWGGTPEEGGLISELWVEGAFPAKATDDERGGKVTTLDDLVADGKFNADLRDQLHRRDAVPRDRPLYLHQRDAILRAQEPTATGGRPALIVTAGTGAGKTESFLLPLLNDLYSVTPQKREGVECIILYPMNALVNDQVERLYSWLEGQGNSPRCTLFHMTSETPEDVKVAKRLGIKAPDDPCRMWTRKQARGLETKEGYEIEAKDRAAPPRILITNYSMLEYMLCRPQDAPFFGANLRTVVLDEAHLYTGTLAAEMTLLLRRLLARCGKRSEEVLQIATSATIGGDLKDLGDFAVQLLSKDRQSVRLVEGQSDHVSFLAMEPPAQEPTAEAICADPWLDQPTLTRGAENRIELATDKQTCEALREPLRLLVSERRIEMAMAEAEGRPAVLLSSTLLHAPLIAKAEDILWRKRRLPLTEFAKDLFGEVNETTRQATTRLLQFGAAARRRAFEYPVLPHRLHLLARTTAGLSVCLNALCSGDDKLKLEGLGCVLEGVRERCPYCLAAAVTLVRCDHCGEWALGGVPDGQRVHPILERWMDGKMPEGLHIYSFREASGGIVRMIDSEGRFNGKGSIRVWETKDCASCGESDQWVPFITSDPYTLSTLSESVLSELPHYSPKNDEWLPARGRRLLTFSDSRQEAARLGPRMTRSHELQVFRAALARALVESRVNPATIVYYERKLAEALASLNDTELPDELQQEIRKEAEGYKSKLANVRSGGTIEEWCERLKSSPLTRQFMDEDFSDSDQPEDWSQKTQLAWKTNTEKVKTGLRKRVNRELASPARKQVSLETLGLAEIVYPRLEELSPPQGLIQEIYSPEALANLHENWTALLALLCDDLRANGCVTLGTPEDDDEYQLGFYRVGGWCALERANEYTRLQRFIGLSDRQQRRKFMATVLKHCGMSSEEAERSAPLILKVAFNQLLAEAGWDHGKEALTGARLRWLERDRRQCENEGGSVEAIRIRLPHVALRTPAQLYECETTSHLWARHAAGCAPEPGCEKLIEISQEQADASPRYGRLRKELLTSSIFEQGLWAEEHSAQLDPKENRRLQELFKAGARNILSSTTTLELGIDIGGLNAVLMGNMPPGKANYLQRAGRAGRRADGSSVVVTFVRSRPFDREIFVRFGDYLKRELRRPTVALDRDRIGRRHFHAWLLNEFFRLIYPPYAHVGAMRAFGDMGHFCGMVYPERWNGAQKPQFPRFSSDWTKPEDATWWNEQSVTPGLDQQFIAYLRWMRDHGEEMEKTAKTLFSDAAFYRNRKSWSQLIADTETSFCRCVEEWKKDYQALLQAWEAIPAQNNEQGKANAIRYQLETLHDLTVIESLGDEQFLPRYGFPIGVLKLKVIAPDEEKKGRVREEDQFRLERPGLLALREYVPGTQLLVGGKLITSRGIMKHWTGAVTDDAFGLSGIYTECLNGHHYYSLSGELSNCPICGARSGGTPEKLLLPRHGFMSAASEPPRRSTDVEKVGSAEQATITFHENGKQRDPYMPNVADIEGLNAYYAEGGEILVFNKGEYENGFAICTACGYTGSERKKQPGATYPPGFENHTPLRVANKKVKCWKLSTPSTLRNQTLAARETTDVLMLDISEKYGFKSHAKDKNLMLTLARALQASGAKLLELDEREIGVMIVPTGEGGEYFGAALYDNVPGGAGHVLEILKRQRKWLDEARQIMFVSKEHDEQCESACLDCLLNFSAQFDSSILKRRAALKLLDALLNDIPPGAEEELILVEPKGGNCEAGSQALLEERERRRKAKRQS